jgi:hypothetical protein
VSRPRPTAGVDVASRGEARRDRWLVAAIPLLLVLVATTQMVVASSTTLTPWRGGGFGMFATVDAHSTRIVRAEVELAAGSVLPVDVRSFRLDAASDRAFVTARAWPSEPNLRRLAAALHAAPAVIDGGIVRHTEAVSSADGQPRSIDEAEFVAVEVAVWRLRFDRTTREVTPERLASARDAT